MKKIVFRVEDNMNRNDILCTTYQMRNFYSQFHDGFFTNLDVMNYIQHYRAAQIAKKGMNIVDVCCGSSLMLPLLRYYAKNINPMLKGMTLKTEFFMDSVKIFWPCSGTY